MIESRHIKILPDFIANQIAAGEVVQRPESVIKELVENSLDAGATSIAVIVKGAGKQMLHIVDNGSGMSRDDLAISCKRHSTSKILTPEDLEDINTFGFRGEALASISAVANVEIRTRTHGEETGWKIVAEPMKEEVIEPVSTDFGTQVFVRNLFYNVPARRKFLKTDLTEFRYISDTMLKFTLSKPEVRFTFYDDDTLIFDVHPSSLEQRIVNILGSNTSNGLIEVASDNGYVSVSGFVGQPHLAKQSRTGQYLFLNGRSIINKSLSHAVYSAFEHLLEKSVNPLFILNLKLDARQFDVNVHPQKHEVKFEDERAIYSLIHRAVNLALQKNNLAPAVKFSEELSQSPFEKVSFGPNSSQPDMMLVNKLTGEIVDPARKQESYSQNSYSLGFSERRYEDRLRQEFRKPETSAYELIFGSGTKDNEISRDIAPIPQSATIWQLHKKYIFTQTDKGLMILDQHAAHERVLYERAVKAMNREFSYSQELLFPANIKLTASEISAIKEIESELHNLGYGIKIIETDEIEIKAVPLDVVNGGEINSFKEIIHEYIESQTIKTTDKRDRLAASYSCKAAIKTGQSLSPEEMKKLIQDLFLCEVPYACPHGRPVILEFTLQEFDKRFGRI